MTSTSETSPDPDQDQPEHVDPRALTPREKEYRWVPDEQTIQKMSWTIRIPGRTANARIYMPYQTIYSRYCIVHQQRYWPDEGCPKCRSEGGSTVSSRGPEEVWTPSKPWTPDIPFPMGILVPYLGAPWLPSFRSMASFRITGIRFSGKSALGEAIATRFLQNGSSVYDLYAANDNESLAWLDSPYSDRVILLHGRETTLKCAYRTMCVDDLDPRYAPDGCIFVMGKSFFANEELYYRALDRLSQLFVNRDEWRIPHVIIVREAQEWIAGRMRSGRPRSAKDSAEEFVTFHNSLFHTGYAVIIDSQRDIGVLKDVRELCTWTMMKAQGAMEIPRKLNYLMRDMVPEAIRHLHKHCFILLGENGQYAACWFLLPPWHIVRGTSIIKRLGIEVSYDEEKTSEQMSQIREAARVSVRRPPAIGDELHRKIVAEHMGLNGTIERPAGKSYRVISLENDISEDSAKRTWMAHKIGVCHCPKSDTLD